MSNSITKKFSIFSLLLISVAILSSLLTPLQALAAGTFRWQDPQTIREMAENGAYQPWQKISSSGITIPAGYNLVYTQNGRTNTTDYIFVSDSKPSIGARYETNFGRTLKTFGIENDQAFTGNSTSTNPNTQMPFIKGTLLMPNGDPAFALKPSIKKLDPKTNQVTGQDFIIHPGHQDNVFGWPSSIDGKTDWYGNFRTDGPLKDGEYLINIDVSAKDAQQLMTSYFAAAGFGSTAAAIVSVGCTVATMGACALPVVVGGVVGTGVVWLKEKYKDSTQGEPRLRGKAVVSIKNGQVSPSVATIKLDEVIISPLQKALSNTIAVLAEFVTTALKFVMSAIDKLLNATEEIVLGVGVEGAWTKIRNIALSLLVLALIIIAFANTLSIDIERYGLNRIIPKIIISIIMAFLSWFIVSFFFDFTHTLQKQAYGLMGGGNGLDILGNITFETPNGADLIGQVGSTLLLIVILIGVLVCGVVLLFSLLMRVVVLTFLLAVAPLAFMLNILPFTEKLYSQWWTNFWKWMFMGPVAVIIIALGSVIASGLGGGPVQNVNGMSLNGDVLSSPSTAIEMMLGLFILAASIYLAGTLPAKWGGEIMSSWQKVGKKVGSWGFNKVPGVGLTKDMWKRRKANAEGLKRARYDRAAGLTANALNKIPGVGGTIATRAALGTNKAGAMAMSDAAKESFKKEWASASVDDLRKAAASPISKINPMAMQALAEIAQEKHGDATKLFAQDGELDSFGNWNPGANQDAAETQAAIAFYPHMKNTSFRNMMMKENQGLVTAIAAENNDSNLLDLVNRKNKGEAANNINASYVSTLNKYAGRGNATAAYAFNEHLVQRFSDPINGQSEKDAVNSKASAKLKKALGDARLI